MQMYFTSASGLNDPNQSLQTPPEVIVNVMNKKTAIYFGPPLAKHTESEKNTLMISGRLNRTAERYMEIMREHDVELSRPERECLIQICQVGFMSPQEIRGIAIDVKHGHFQIPELDKDALYQKLAQASYADLVAIVESLGY